jgi:hypothetical protein
MKFQATLIGHQWNDDNIDSQCVLNKSNDEKCLMTRAQLFNTKPEDVNKNGIAHSGQLTQTEYEYIRRERESYEQHCERIMDALRQICG